MHTNRYQQGHTHLKGLDIIQLSIQYYSAIQYKTPLHDIHPTYMAIVHSTLSQHAYIQGRHQLYIVWRTHVLLTANVHYTVDMMLPAIQSLELIYINRYTIHGNHCRDCLYKD